MAPDEAREGERREHADRPVQHAREHISVQHEADREQEVLEELHVAPEAPGRVYEPPVLGIQSRVHEVILHLIAADRRRQHGDELRRQDQAAHDERRPRLPEHARIDRTDDSHELATPSEEREYPDDRERRDPEVIGRGQSEPDHTCDPETHRQPSDEAVTARVRRQRVERAQHGETAGRSHHQECGEEEEIDHRYPRYPSQYTT